MPGPAKQLTVRLPPKVAAQLALVAKLRHYSKNALVVEAIEHLLVPLSKQLAEEMSPRLEQLRRYASNPIRRTLALEALVNDEAELGDRDPAEGVRVKGATGRL